MKISEINTKNKIRMAHIEQTKNKYIEFAFVFDIITTQNKEEK
jgi:hypothetical protein